jgi:hypothetical protein
MEMSDRIHTLAILPTDNKTKYPLNSRYSEAHSHSGHFGKETKISRPFLGTEESQNRFSVHAWCQQQRQKYFKFVLKLIVSLHVCSTFISISDSRRECLKLKAALTSNSHKIKGSIMDIYCCTVHSEDSLIIKHQQMHYSILCLF